MTKIKFTLAAFIAAAVFVFNTANAQNTFPSSGNVGIGTTTPSYLLHVNSSGGTVQMPGDFRIGEYGTLGVAFLQARDATVAPNYRRIDFQFRTSKDAYPYVSDVLRLTWDAKVGVKTSSPVQDFHVNGISCFQNNMIIGATFTPTSRLDIIGLSSTSSTSALNISNMSGSSMFFVRDDGRVGLNNTSPTSKLDIKGAGSTSSTSSLNIANSGGNSLLKVWDNGFMGVNTVSPFGRVHVENDVAAPGIVNPIGVYSHTGGGDGTAVAYAVQGTADNSDNAAYGVAGLAAGGNSSTGVYGYSSSGTYSYGVHGAVSAGTNRYGVYGLAANQANSYAGYFVGNVHATGTVTWSSDQKLKRNIEPLESSLDKINLLQPKTYQFRTDEFEGMNLPSGNQIGLIAQDLEKVFPELVMDNVQPPTHDAEGNLIHSEVEFKSVNYTGLIPVLVGGIKEQQEQITALQNEVAELKAIVNALRSEPNQDIKGSSATLNDNGTTPVLYQNAPNPTNSSTIIRYYAPVNDEQAQLVVTDIAGRAEYLKLNLEKGNGQVEIRVGTIPAGTYIYSLIINGEKIDTKKMVIAE